MSQAQPDPIETDLNRWSRTLTRSASELKATIPWLVDAHKRNRRAGRVTRTGLPSTTSGAGGQGRGKGGTSDPVGESAAARADAELGLGTQVIDDPFDADLRGATRALEEAAEAAGRASLLVRKLQERQGEVPNVQHCEACAVAGVRHPWDRFARDLRGLVTPMHLCDAAYQFVSKRGRLPSAEEAKYYDERGRWKIRIDPTATSPAVPA